MLAMTVEIMVSEVQKVFFLDYFSPYSLSSILFNLVIREQVESLRQELEMENRRREHLVAQNDKNLQEFAKEKVSCSGFSFVV